MAAARLIVLAAALLWGPAQGAPACPPLLQQPFTPLLEGPPGDLCRFAGQVVLVVNTASRCAFTPQYKGLEALHERYKDRGLAVVGFPSNDFGAQEPGAEAQIKDFCETTYGVRFALHAKTAVTGPAAHPLYQALRARTGEAPGWNFHKYLISADGRRVQSFESRVRPESETLVRAIEAGLAEREHANTASGGQ